MAPKAKDSKATDATPVITTHHSLPAGGGPADSTEESADSAAEPVLTRPKKLILQPLHESIDSDSEQVEPLQESTEKIDDDSEGEPLVLETAADTAASTGAAKPAELPTEKIELPLEDVTDELEDESSEVSVAEVPKATAKPEPESTTDVNRPEAKDPGEGAAAKQAIDANEARSQKAEALMASGKYQVRIHESTRSRTGFTIGLVTAAVVLLAFTYYAAAEQVINVGFDVPAFWR